jgi:hypothetical protein
MIGRSKTYEDETMPSAFVISTPQFTAGILSSQGRGLRFEASDAKTCSLQNRIFATPEAAQWAVERLMTRKSSVSQERFAVSCRPLF